MILQEPSRASEISERVARLWHLFRDELLVSFEGGVEAEEVDGEEGVGEVQVLVDLVFVAQHATARSPVKHDPVLTSRWLLTHLKPEDCSQTTIYTFHVHYACSTLDDCTLGDGGLGEERVELTFPSRTSEARADSCYLGVSRDRLAQEYKSCCIHEPLQDNVLYESFKTDIM